MKYWIVFFALLTCHTKNIYAQDTTAIQKVIEEVKSQYAPDNRTSVYSIRLNWESNQLILQGEIWGEKIHRELLSRIKSLSATSQNQVKDQITLLPSKSLADKTQGVITLSVANIRTRPAEAAEMATQALLGTPIRIIDKSGGWLRIQTPDNYIGWTPQASLQSMDQASLEDWENAIKVIYTQTYGFAYTEPNLSSQRVSDLVAGNIFEMEKTEGDFFKVHYPDGRNAYIHKNESMLYEQWIHSRELNKKNIVETAKLFMGVPYLWGGTSPKGMDCSGFSKIVYFLNGHLLTRDASQQVFEGILVDTRSGYDQIKAGDLLFFGEKASETKKERVVHVAISLGGTEFIHASTYIRLSSLDSKSPLYDEFNTRRLLRVKRIIQ